MLDWIDKVPEAVLTSVSYKDKVYGVPLNIHRVNTFFYNKEVFEDVGMHVERPDDARRVFERRRDDQGVQRGPASDAPPITPIAMGFSQTQGDMATDDTWTLALLFFENILVARLGGTRLRQPVHRAQAATTRTWQIVMAKALDDFRKLVSYSNVNASALTWNEPLDMVLNGDAAMTIMGDWGKGYANSKGADAETFGAVPTPGTAGTFVFTTDTFGLTMGAKNARDTMNLLKLFGSREGQDIFNPIKGSISARSDSDISNGRYDAMAKQTYYDFKQRRRRCPRRRSWRRRATWTRSARRSPSSRARATTATRASCSTRWTTTPTCCSRAAGRRRARELPLAALARSTATGTSRTAPRAGMRSRERRVRLISGYPV